MGGILSGLTQGTTAAVGSDVAKDSVTDSVTNAATKSATKGTTTKGLDISDMAVAKIRNDMLAETGGLADIFAKEGASGLHNSTVGKQAAGDLSSKIVGEIAKLRAKEVTSVDEETDSNSVSNTHTNVDENVDNKGQLERVFGSTGHGVASVLTGLPLTKKLF